MISSSDIADAGLGMEAMPEEVPVEIARPRRFLRKANGDD